MISNCKKRIKLLAYFLMIDMLLSIVSPTISSMYALTSGPGTPEFSSFEPVATSNLVDPLTGSFTYNLPVIQIPGPDGGGYAMSLSYHSGTSAEEESSWVGHGWTLNPGAINKGVRGLPDEYNDTPVDIYNKTRPNWTMSGSEKLNLEFFSQSKEQESGAKPNYDKPVIGLGVSKYVRFNNYQGLAKTISLSLSKQSQSLSMNRSATGITFSAELNPFALTQKAPLREKKDKDKINGRGFVRFDKEGNKKMGQFASQALKNSGMGAGAQTLFGYRSFTDAGISTSLSKMRGYNFNLSFGLQFNALQVPVGIEGGLTGAFSLNTTKSFETVSTYGYLNTPSEIGNFRSDYFTEKGKPFDRRDYFIGIPFSTPDNYMLSGEGLSGGFRPYRKSIGNYFPEQIDGSENKIKTYGVGVEVMLGLNAGVGVNLALGGSKSKLKDWNRVGNTNNDEFSFNSSSQDEHQFRFYGDKGGKMEYGNTNIAKARLKAQPNFPGITTVSPTLSNDDLKDLNEVDASSSSFISKEDEGFSIYNNAGLKYNYTLDMKVRNTANLSIDINQSDRIEENYLAFKELYLKDNFEVDECIHEVLIGDVKKTPYTSTSLLTSITTSDYIDLGEPGKLDELDFGGWTSFEYFKKYGGNEDSMQPNDEDNYNWYRWRIPYNGLFYSKNDISDIKDDTGFVSTGEKEINYLKIVETKTHIAYFVTNKSNSERFGVDASNVQAKYLQGTGVNRFDGLAATDLTSTQDPSASDPSSKNLLDQLEYLEKVVLFAKGRPDVPLQTTNFKYDYTLVGNLPNNINGNFPSNSITANSGKLTLKKVWSEFEGVVSARISSYKFDYRYKDKAEYPQYLLDAWGNVQFNGRERHINMVNWPYQGAIPQNSFDPAAWQLKQITLPSGGQILMEYESKDYSYVQDRNVMAMVKLIEANDDYEAPSYTLDLTDIGYDSNIDADQIQDLHQYLRAYFLEEKDEISVPIGGGGIASILSKDKGLLKVDKRIYFKLLYALEGLYPELENCKSEYISGYAKVKDVVYNSSTNQISIQLDGTSDGTNLIGVGLFDEPVEDQGYKLTPRQACYDYYVTQRWGKFSAGCEGDFEKKYDRRIKELAGCEGPLINNIGEALAIAEFTIAGMTTVSSMAINSKYPTKTEVCKTLNPELSYLKIPINKAKRGDGIRVKRVLMFDKGIENGDAAIYGQEYRYELEDGRSSGVATNEPSEMREENPLVGFMPKEDQSWISRLVVGKDKEQSEGPIGESLLPSPAVNYARIVVENIHKGKTGSGHTVYEFFTCKDYPFDKLYNYSQSIGGANQQYDIGYTSPVKGVDYSVLQNDSFDDKLNIPAPVFSYKLDKAWASQGFRFIVNEMNGKPKSIRTYGGSYKSGDRSFISSGQDFYYYEPGEKVPLMKGDGTYYWDNPGKEMDVTMEKYTIKNENLDFNFEIDVSVGISLFPPIFVSGMLQFEYSEQYLSKYAISKVINYPAIQKKIVSYSDNIASTTENLAFDYGTGESVLTKTYDAYHNINVTGSTVRHDGSIYSMNIPAHWNYEAMGRKSENRSYTNQLMASSGQIITYGNDANPLNPNIVGDNYTWNIKADKVISAGANTFNTMSGVSSWVDSNVSAIYNSESANSELEKIWRLHKSFVFKGETSKSSNRNTALGKIYEGGIIESFIPFDYANIVQDQQWVKLSEVTKYSPNGNALEEQDVLDIFSASKFGYDFTQPIIIAQNSTYDEIFFEHFEDKIEQGFSNIIYGNAHSGMYSQEIASGTNLLRNVIARELLSTTGGWLKFWVKSDSDLLNPKIVAGADVYTPELVAKTGEWSLYRTFIDPSSLSLGNVVDVQLTFDNTIAYIDDIKFNPKESQTTCFVYDVKSLRLLTLFDDQHFGLYYQYNSEGQLVRKLIETERGLKVITETQYNTPRENRENF